MTADHVPAELVSKYQAAIETQPDIEFKGGAKLPFTSINGYMYSSLTKDGRMGIRLSAEDREAFMEEHDAIPFTNYGSNIREHVEVPADVVEDPVLLGEYLAKSRAYTLTLPPKKKK